MENYSMRAYQRETDFETVYEWYCDHCFKTTAYQLHGANPCPEKKEFEKLADRAGSRGMQMILDAEGKLVGYCGLGQLYRVGWHREVYLTLWERQEALTEPIFRELLERAFSLELLKMVLCKVTGENTALVAACRKAGMEEVGCIPDYYCYEGKLYPEYTFILRRETAE